MTYREIFTETKIKKRKIKEKDENINKKNKK